MKMRFVESVEEIKDNMDTLDRYLNEKRGENYEYALEKVQKGLCFVADNSSGRYKFYPSRFVGYADNTRSLHEINEDRDGRDTNPVISRILGRKRKPDEELETAYKDYCACLGFTPYNRRHKFLRLDAQSVPTDSGRGAGSGLIVNTSGSLLRGLAPRLRPARFKRG